jgi:hypothetical protein
MSPSAPARYNARQEDRPMPPPFIGPNDRIPDPATLPRGLIRPPQEVLDVIAREKARHVPKWAPEYELLTMNELTLVYYFQHQLVAYRQTPQGPEVLGVGEEVFELLNKTPPEQLEDVHVIEP